MHLIIAEKDIAARRIAQILFGKVVVRKIKSVNVYFSPDFKAYVIGLKGHIVELDFPPGLKNWRKTPLLELLRTRLVKRIKHRKIVSALRALAKRVNHVTIATDYDREGELIGLEALEILKSANPKITFDRMRFSAITREDILMAFRKREKINYNLAYAAIARQKIDLIWGCALTRLLSLMHNKLKKRDFLSAGRVQSPVLRLIIEREEEIKNFTPVKYWQIGIVIEKEGKKLKLLSNERFLSKEIAEKILEKIGDKCKVESFKEKRVKEKKPIPFNTTEFLKEANMFFPPEKAMEIAERLYMKGFISYPRTDNTVYPKTLDLRKIAKILLKTEFNKYAQLVLNQERILPSKGKKETRDHPPIHVTAPASKNHLSREEWIIYELIARRFLATLYKNALWKVKECKLTAANLNFEIKGKELLHAGWREIYSYSKAEQMILPDFKEGEEIEILEKSIEEKQTSPPKRYNEGEMIKIMERLGLGTKATRHEILQKLKQRKYISSRPLKPKETAYLILNSLKEIAEEITLPSMTAELERKMDLIEEGKISEKEVVEESKRKLKEILLKAREKMKNTSICF